MIPRSAAPTHEDVLRGLGLYRVLNQANTAFGSIVYRMLTGVLGLLFPEALALDTAIEFLLNAVLEIPFGRLADKYGRVRCAKVGLLLYATCGITCFAAIQFSGFAWWSYAFIIVSGVLLGVATPLVSGSIEGFYQDAANVFAREGDAPQHSFALSEKYGKFIPTFATLVAFGLLYFFYRAGIAAYLFFFVSAAWIFLWAHVSRNARDFGDQAHAGVAPRPFGQVFRELFRHPRVRHANALLLVATACRCVVMGYLLVSLGRGLAAQFPHSYWWVLASFMLGSLCFGWIAKGYVLPYLVQRLPTSLYLGIFAALILAASALGLWWWEAMTFTQWLVFVAIYGAVFQIGFSAMHAFAVNAVLGVADRRDYATAMSVSSMPGYLFIASYSFYLIAFRSGAPNLREAFATLVALSVVLTLLAFCAPAAPKK